MDGLSHENEVLTSVLARAPVEPFLVVIMMTPFAARDPYRAAAFGPFSTDMVAMSAGLMSLIALPRSYPEFESPPRSAFEIGTPSTMNTGWLLPVIEFAPRMMMFDDPPCVLGAVIVTPETLPSSCSTTLSAFV